MSLNSIKQEETQEEPSEEEDVAELLRRAEAIIQENRERIWSRRSQAAESLREQAIALLREPSPVLELNENTSNFTFPVEEPPQLAINNCTIGDSDDDVIFVNSVQQPPQVVDLSTPDPTLPKRRRRRRIQNSTDNVVEIVNTCTNEEKSANDPNAKTKGSSSCGNTTGEVAINCVICLDNCQKPTAALCGHIFCYKCIRTAIKIMHKCPMCKRKLSLKSIHPLYFN